MSDDDTDWDSSHQQHIIEPLVELKELDAALLAQLAPVDRARQLGARRALWWYFDRMWDAVKNTHPTSSPATRNPYNSVAAMKDFAEALYATASQAASRRRRPSWRPSRTLRAGPPPDEDHHRYQRHRPRAPGRHRRLAPRRPPPGPRFVARRRPPRRATKAPGAAIPW
ncbi:hypothetical protein AB0B45_48245 [Nonomuraea sp. NPDC049152]|uniref:hypothetical protein n=1 Tax=Nonomuraea sp. NPDC049152 TaxID=3154350 RepID=UPI0033EF6D17